MPGTSKSAKDHPEVLTMEHYSGVAGETIAVSGLNLTEGMTVKIGDILVPLENTTTSLASFTIPENVSHNLTEISFLAKDNSTVRSFPLWLTLSTDTTPVMEIDPALVCGGVSYRNRAGESLSGQRDCSGKALPCKTDGEVGCQATTTLPAIYAGGVQNVRDKFSSSIRIAGIAGSSGNCARDGEKDCITDGTSYSAAQTYGAAAKIVLGERVAGIDGTGIKAPDACAGDMTTNCLSNSSYRSVDLASLDAASIRENITIANTTGTLIAAALVSACNLDGALGCVSSSTFPAMSLTTLNNSASRYRSSLSLGGVSGSLGDCASDGDDDCVVIGPSFAAAALSGAAAKILFGETVAGVGGSAPLKPLDCANEGDTDCVAVSAYPAIKMASLSSGIIKNGTTILGVTGDYPSSTYKLSSNTATTDLTNLATQMLAAASFEFFDSAGVRYVSSGDTDLVTANIKSGVTFENLNNLTGIIPGSPIRAPSPMTSSYASSAITIQWQDTGAAGYLLVRRTKAPVDFVPTNLTAYTAGDTSGDNEVLYVGSGTSYTDSSISTANGYSYSYAVYAFDSNSYYSQDAATTTQMLNLCTGLSGSWVAVPGDSSYGTTDFCVMKYEAKNVSGVATSQAASIPWNAISQTSAQTQCQSLGSIYSLVTNKEWLTITSNIASNPLNWSGGAVGSGALNVGHTDDNPSSLCAASASDTLAWVEGSSDCTGKTQSASGDEWIQKRTHTLSNGSIIWDIAGSTWEWTSYSQSVSAQRPYSSAYYSTYGAWVTNYLEFPVIDSGFSNLARSDLLPINSLKYYWDDNWTATQGIGRYRAGNSSTGGAMLRGGGYSTSNTNPNAGLFAMLLEQSGSTYTSYNVGFRCTAHP